jgi:germination protein M
MSRSRSSIRPLLAIVVLAAGLLTAGVLAPVNAARQAGDPDPFVTLYFLRDGDLGATARATRSLPQDISIQDGALIDLARGPLDSERAAGLSTALATDTRLLRSVTVDAATGVATADFGPEFAIGTTRNDAGRLPLRMAQIVFTLTQFDGIESVAFLVDGEPLTSLDADGNEVDGPVGREHFERVSPAILLERPGVWQEISSPLALSGTANTFEATVSYRLVDQDGRVIVDGFLTATSGSGTRGTFDEEVTFEAEPGRATLVLFEQSAMDGSEINIVAIPVEIANQAGSEPTVEPTAATEPEPTATAALEPTATTEPAAEAGSLTVRLYVCPADVTAETAARATCDLVLPPFDAGLRLEAPSLAKPLTPRDFKKGIDAMMREPIFVREGMPLDTYTIVVTRMPEGASAMLAVGDGVAGSVEDGFTVTLDATNPDRDIQVFFLAN